MSEYLSKTKKRLTVSNSAQIKMPFQMVIFDRNVFYRGAQLHDYLQYMGDGNWSADIFHLKLDDLHNLRCPTLYGIINDSSDRMEREIHSCIFTGCWYESDILSVI